MASDPILIIDDNPANLKVARFALESEGHRVWTAADAEEAIELLREIRPRLILMDIQLPGMDGLDLTRQLKADPATKEILIIAVTAYAMKGDRERALRAGCDGYITKPIDPILLPTQVADCFARAGHEPAVTPRTTAPPAAAPAPGEPDARRQPADSEPTGTSEQRILLVEDNPATRRMFRVALESAGYDVLEAADGGAALDALRRRPALIIQDLVLPDMDGLELARRIRQELGDAPLPIICVSGFLSRLDEARAMKGGFAHVLVKPVDPFDLLDAVKIHLTAPSTFTQEIGEGRLLIVVEDDPLERKLAQVWFSSVGFNVLVASDGDEGLALARRERPAAIVSDVLMPRSDGFTLCLAVRRDPELNGVPVILTSSAYAEKADLELARRVGATALLPKAGGLEGVTRALAAALTAPPTTIATESVELIEREHGLRARAQLERQVLENSSLLRRSRLQQAQLAILAGVAEALGKSVLADGVLGDVLASTLDMAGVSKGALYLRDGEKALELKHQIGFSESESLRLRAQFGQTALFSEIATGDRVVALPSSAVNADVTQRLLIDAGVTSLLFVPVHSGVKSYGAMLLGARNADVTGEDALAFARVLGAQMGQAVGLAQAFEQLRASEIRNRTLTENASDAICILTTEGVIREANRRLAEILGVPIEHLLGRHLDDLAAPGRARANMDRYRATLAANDRSIHLYEAQRQNGDVALLEFSMAAVDVAGQSLVLAIGRDVTDARQRAELLALGTAVGLALAATDSLYQALQKCCEALVTHLGAAVARIWTLNEHDKVLELRASAGLDTQLDGTHGKVPLGKFKIGRIALNRTPHLTNAVIGDPEVGDQEWARREGMVAFAGHPLIVDGRLVGVMALFSRQRLSAAVISTLASVSDHIALGIARHHSAEARRVAEERTRFALEAAGVGIWDMDFTTGDLQWSEILEAQYGLQPGTFGRTVAAFIERVHPADREAMIEEMNAHRSGGEFTSEHRALWPDGTTRWLSGAGRVLLDELGQPTRAVGISRDITERRTLEEQFQQAQKMEAVGRLAGGVAHDFNNLLTVILGLCEVLLAERDPEDRQRSDIAEIQEAGNRAAGLTRQLLAFSRKQIIEPTLLDLNEIVAAMGPMLGRLIGEDVSIVVAPGPGLARVKADRGQIEQVVMNLAVNARDAMPNGGTLTLETANVELDEHYAATHLAAKPGLYVVLMVTDTGTGMTPEVQARLFEPFFTTKGPGKGTGLGMATVYGVVTRSGGSVGVYSEVGKGTSFKVYLPRADASEMVVQAPAPVVVRPRGGGQTILLVEDEPGLRELSRRLLQRLGYTTLVASDGDEALRLFAENPSIDLLLTDVVMPGASGPELTRQLLEQRPALNVIYMSGYTEDAITHHGVLKPGIAFLNKPFTSASLGQKIREVLDR